MRIANLNLRGRPTLAARKNNKYVNLAVAAPKLPRDLKGLLEMGEEGMAAVKKAIAKPPAKAVIPVKDAMYLPPMLNPSKILCLGVNYAAHAKEMKSAKPEFPVIFARHSNTLVGHGGAMVRPALLVSLRALIAERKLSLLEFGEAPSQIWPPFFQYFPATRSFCTWSGAKSKPPHYNNSRSRRVTEL